LASWQTLTVARRLYKTTPYNRRMSQHTYEVIVRKDLEDLIPGFLANRQNEVGLLASALLKSDFAQLRQVGHRMKGVGGSYGFALITALGQQIEKFVSTCDLTGLAACVAQYRDFLSKLRVTFK
jgi:HPt (histidine-containing phosphotransfer) domain-containing protein